MQSLYAYTNFLLSFIVENAEKDNDKTSLNQETSAQNTEAAAETVETTNDQEQPLEDGVNGADTDAATSASKNKAPARRKSGGVPEHKKKLNKKASKKTLSL